MRKILLVLTLLGSGCVLYDVSDFTHEAGEELPVFAELDPEFHLEEVLVKGGCFEMGDTFGEGEKNERPVHEVCIDDFYIGIYEVTQWQWEEIMRGNPSDSKSGKNYPVESVNWQDLQDFIRRLNQMTGKNYRLPTEAEWEYAARSGGKKERIAGARSSAPSIEPWKHSVIVRQYAWYRGNSGGTTHPVGQKKPNGLGIYDMSGNVYEWCQDVYDENYYKKSPKNNPRCTSRGGGLRVVRGGCFANESKYCRTSYRGWFFTTDFFRDEKTNIGFRLVRTP